MPEDMIFMSFFLTSPHLTPTLSIEMEREQNPIFAKFLL